MDSGIVEAQRGRYRCNSMSSASASAVSSDGGSCKDTLVKDGHERRFSDDGSDTRRKCDKSRDFPVSEICLSQSGVVPPTTNSDSVNMLRAETSSNSPLLHLQLSGPECHYVGKSPMEQKQFTQMEQQSQPIPEQAALKLFFQQVPLTDLRNFETLVRGDLPTGGSLSLHSEEIATAACGDLIRQEVQRSIESPNTEASINTIKRNLDDDTNNINSCLPRATLSETTAEDYRTVAPSEAVMHASPRTAIWSFEQLSWGDTQRASSLKSALKWSNQLPGTGRDQLSAGNPGSNGFAPVAVPSRGCDASPLAMLSSSNTAAVTATRQQPTEPLATDTKTGPSLSPVGAALRKATLSPIATKSFWVGMSPSQNAGVGRVFSPSSGGLLLSSLSSDTLEGLTVSAAQPCDIGNFTGDSKKFTDALSLGLPRPSHRESPGSALRPSDPDNLLADIEALTSISTAPPISPSPASSVATTSFESSFGFSNTPFGCGMAGGSDWSRTARSFVDSTVESSTSTSDPFQGSASFILNTGDSRDTSVEGADIVDDSSTNLRLPKSKQQSSNNCNYITKSLHSGQEVSPTPRTGTTCLLGSKLASSSPLVSSRSGTSSRIPRLDGCFNDTHRERNSSVGFGAAPRLPSPASAASLPPGILRGLSPPRHDNALNQRIASDNLLTSCAAGTTIGPLPETLEDILRSLTIWDTDDTYRAGTRRIDRDACTPSTLLHDKQPQSLQIGSRCQAESDDFGAATHRVSPAESLMRFPEAALHLGTLSPSSSTNAAASLALASAPDIGGLHQLTALGTGSARMGASDGVCSLEGSGGGKAVHSSRSARPVVAVQKMQDNDCSCRLCGQPTPESKAGVLGLGEGMTMGAAGFSGNNSMGLFPGPGGRHFGAPVVLAHPVEFKNPSSFLKVYGDPLCTAAANGMLESAGGGLNGNWDCQRCGNINYPRRFRCNKCNEVRGSRGDAVVSAYAAAVYLQHLQTYRRLGFGDAAIPIDAQGSQKSSSPPGISATTAAVCAVAAPVGANGTTGVTPVAASAPAGGANRRGSNRAPRSANWAPNRRITRPAVSKITSLISSTSLSPVATDRGSGAQTLSLLSQSAQSSVLTSSVGGSVASQTTALSDLATASRRVPAAQGLQSLAPPPPPLEGKGSCSSRGGFRGQLAGGLSQGVEPSASWS